MKSCSLPFPLVALAFVLLVFPIFSSLLIYPLFYLLVFLINFLLCFPATTRLVTTPDKASERTEEGTLPRDRRGSEKKTFSPR